MTARIYKPTKNAMQSGMKNTRQWILEYISEKGKSLDPLMGWTGSSDMESQVKLKFATKEDAIAYAKRNGLAYEVVEPKMPKRRIKAYADVFAYRG
ncbi:ETC complex I subunit [Paremcibacter congregatus]|mgnify:CR=1 FL=1|uniref:ETC complex I subunit n=1 Tax=Paremcibacter congregatus TaxID=2043170 RepID=UPI0030EE93FA